MLRDRAAALQASPAGSAGVLAAQVDRLLGIYEAVPPGETIPGTTHLSAPALDSLPLTAEAVNARAAAPRPAIDPKDACQVLGPFRMMARPDTKFEILQDAPDKLVLLFEQSSWGHVRTIRMNAQHSDFTHIRPMWNGDSIGRWEGDTLVIDSLHFTDKTWLNEVGVANTKQLQLTERVRLVSGGKYLQYEATAVDPAVLAHPVSYVRYFRRTAAEIEENNCFDHRPGRANSSP